MGLNNVVGLCRAACYLPTTSSQIGQNDPRQRLRSAGGAACVRAPGTRTPGLLRLLEDVARPAWASLMSWRGEAKLPSGCALSGEVEKPVGEEWGKTVDAKEAARLLAKNLNRALWDLHVLSYAMETAISVTPWRDTSEQR